MTTAITVAPDAGQVTNETLESVVVGGDLSKLSPGQRLEWYSARCQAAGLDPRTQPFQYITLQGKLTLYATKAATDQLISSRGLNVTIVDRRADADLGIYEVQVRVTTPEGRTVDDLAAVTIKGLSGDALCNAYMKCLTKAKRRTVLSACGLGALDETETETIRGAHYVTVNPGTGEIVQCSEPRQIEQAPAKAAAATTARKGEPNKHGLSDAQIKRIFGIARSNDVTADQVKALMAGNFGFDSTSELTRAQYDQLCDSLIPASQSFSDEDAALLGAFDEVTT